MKTAAPKYIAGLMFLALFAFFAACSDDDTTVGPVPPNTATISFSSPVADSLYTGNGNITFSGAIESTYPVQGYMIVLRRKSDNTQVMSKSFPDKDTVIAFNEVWQNNMTVRSDLEVEVVANLDATGNTASQKVSFQAAP